MLTNRTLLFSGVLLLAFSFVSRGQTLSDLGPPTPFDPDASYNTLVVKGKVLPWLGVVASGFNASFGIEQSFRKRHSVGMDLYFNAYSYDTADIKDSSGNWEGGPATISLTKQFL
jgi:hypothetical protein